MRNRRLISGWLLVLILFAISSCDGAPVTESVEGGEPTASPPVIGLANPASVHCEEQGYTLEMRTDANGGTYGVCIFPDGSECEEWAFFRGECGPGEAAPPPEEPAPDASYEGISFSFDDSLASGVTAETVPAMDEEYLPYWEIIPEHVKFLLEGYLLSGTFYEPRILVYPVQEFAAMSESAGFQIAQLQQNLQDRPASPESFPVLPVVNAPQMLHSQIDYIDFQNGTGMRFVGWFGQGGPANNYELFYSFQGLSDDGGTYVSAFFSVSHPSLPADGSEIPGGDLDAFMANFETYIRETEQQLNAQEPSSFTPDLALLDALIRSLEVPPAPAASVGLPAGSPAGVGGGGIGVAWEPYANETWGYTLLYPANCTVEETDPAASVQFVGPRSGDGHWPWLFVDHYDTDFYHPPDNVDLSQWVADAGFDYDGIVSDLQIAGLPTVHAYYEQGPATYAGDDYYFIKDGQLFHIQILHAAEQQDWDLYNTFLMSFTFP